MENKCCSDSCGCLSINKSKRDIIIDFLYLDLTVCERCQGTEENLKEAIDDVAIVLQSAGYNIIVNNININTRELAVQHKFKSSPTIRVNGRDIAFELKESECKDCGDLCGENVNCRVWNYEGNDYVQAPKELIVNEILKEIYSNNKSIETCECDNYKLPENLDNFFDAIEYK